MDICETIVYPPFGAKLSDPFVCSRWTGNSKYFLLDFTHSSGMHSMTFTCFRCVAESRAELRRCNGASQQFTVPRLMQGDICRQHLWHPVPGSRRGCCTSNLGPRVHCCVAASPSDAHPARGFISNAPRRPSCMDVFVETSHGARLQPRQPYAFCGCNPRDPGPSSTPMLSPFER